MHLRQAAAICLLPTCDADALGEQEMSASWEDLEMGWTLESPPERLHTLLKSIVPGSGDMRSHAAGIVIATATAQPEVNSRRSWYKAFGIIDRMIDDAENFVSARLENYEVSPYSSSFAQIRAAMHKAGLETAWGTIADVLTPLVTASLPFAIHFANQHGAQATAIPRADAIRLRKSLYSLSEEVERSGLPRPIKAVLRSRVAELIESVDRYAIYGTEGIAHAAQGLVVTMTMYEEVKHEEGLLKKAAATINEIQDVLIKAYALYQIAAPIVGKLLTP
jgi:hypothetical protein